MEQAPAFKKKKGISPVWTLPIIALGICIWIVYTSIQNAGITITIYFDDASGITPGKTQVIARGIPIGTVEKIEPDLGNRRIKVVASIDHSVEDLLVKDAQFWVVRPEISAASVQGLDTLVSGSYIGFQPGTSTEKERVFIGLSSPPPISKEAPGLHIKLQAKKLGSIQNGSAIYFRNVSIGEVTQYSLSEDNDTIVIRVFIEPRYAHLVRTGSRFYNASGLSISGKLTNLEINVESLASLIKGGIVLQTPTPLADTPAAEDGQSFTLYEDHDSAKYGIPMTLQLTSSMGITEGETKLIYRGLVAGVVEKIQFNDDEHHTVTAHIMLDPRAERILRAGTRFWIVRPEIGIEKIKNLDVLLSGPYITFIPGEGDFQNDFEILPEPPPQKPLRPGFKVVLRAPQSFAIQSGAPIKYKDKKVGEVLDVELDATLETFTILGFIYERYKPLVRKDSVFWNDGGFSFDASLAALHFEMNSFKAILRGGISFLTPKAADAESGESLESTVFPVHDNYAAALANSQHLKVEGYHFQLRSDNPQSLNVGTPLYFKKVKVGKVTGLSLSPDNASVIIDCFIERAHADTVNSSSRFYNSSGTSFTADPSGVKIETASLQSILGGGISYFTPDSGASKEKNTVFKLYQDKKAAEFVDKIGVLVRFQKIQGLRQGSAVKYRGVKIGEVIDLQFAGNLREILVSLQVDKHTETLFRKNTQIWLEKAKVSLAGVENLNSLLFGPFINIRPGTGELKRQFAALPQAPLTPAESSDGLNLTLVGKHLGSLKINSPLYYRQVVVGKVISYDLAADYRSVHILVNIKKPYVQLIKSNTKFWLASGVRVQGGLFSGVSVDMTSIEALLAGGIALATPEEPEMGESVANNYRFTLHDKARQQWLDWQPTIRLVEEENDASVPK